MKRTIMSIANASIITSEQLSTRLKQGRILPVDATWYLPNVQRNARAEFIQKRLPGARFFDLDKIKDTESSLPHMLPSGELFSTEMRKMGISRSDEIVVYDTSALGIFSAARAYWMFKIFGHSSVMLLNSLSHYSGPYEEGIPNGVTPTKYPVVDADQNRVATYEEVLENIQRHDDVQILDARPSGRFEGVDPELRPGEPNYRIF